MMYDELVKELRTLGTWRENGEVMEQAADAIEELNKYADTIRKLKCEGWYLQQTKYHDGYQAIATTPLPEPPKEETDPCADCRHYPPSSTDGKPCCACDPYDPRTNCHDTKEETE